MFASPPDTSLPVLIPRRRASRSFIALAAALLLSGAAAQVRADAGDDDPEVIAQAKEHYKAGLDAYKAGHYDVAIRELKKAYLLKRIPVLSLNIGSTYRKMGDLDLALHFYQKYLDEAPSDAKDRGEVEKIIADIKQEKSAPAPEETAPKREDDAGSTPRRGGDKGPAGGWNHEVIDAAPPETPIDVRVSTSVMKGVKVFVFYRSAGQADFNSVLMKRRGKEKVGRIPGEAVTGRSLQYYIEAKDSAGTVVKSAGSQSNPNIIMVEEGVKPVMIASGNSGEDEQAEQAEEEDKPKKKKKKPSRDLDEEEAPTTGSVKLRDDEPVRARARKSDGSGMSTLRKAGIGLLAGGGAFAIIGGTMLGLAHNQANTISSDSKNPVDGNNNPIYFNNDPNAGGTQEADLQSRGKTYNLVGILGVTVGGAAIAAGAGCLIADVMMRGEKSHPAKKHKKKKRVVDEEEESTSNWYIAPSVGPTVVGVGGGFSF